MSQEDLTILADSLQGNVGDCSDISQSARLLDSVANRTTTLLAYLDCDFRFVWANNAFLNCCQQTREEFLRRSYQDIFPHDCKQALEQVREHGGNVQVSRQLFACPNHPERPSRYWDWNICADTTYDGQIIGFVISMVDVTDSVSQAELRAEELQEKYLREHHIAQAFQRTLIPTVDVEHPRCRIVADYHPALDEAEVGGDFYDVFELGGERYALIIADVSGKGLKAAVYTAMTKNMARAYVHEDPSPSRVMERLNNALCNYTPDELFVTAFYGVLDTAESTLTYAGAGHDEPLVFRRESADIAQLAATGGALGIIPSGQYEEDVLQLDPGDLLLLYTDGITDARRDKRLFGITGLTEVLESNAHKEPGDIVRAVFHAARTVTGGKLRDDAAVLLVEAR